MSIEMDVQEYNKSQRQWTRTCRMAHARAELAKADPEKAKFWQLVIEANTVKD